MNILTTNGVILNFAHIERIQVTQRQQRAGIRHEVRAHYPNGIRTETIRSFVDDDEAFEMVSDIFALLAKGKRCYTAQQFKPHASKNAIPAPEPADASPPGENGAPTPSE